jgi:lipoprotein NlpD
VRQGTARGFAGLALIAWLAGCGGRAGVYHRVQPGENLYRIGKAYGIPYAELAEVNGLSDPSRIEIGQKLFIPGAQRQLPVDVITPRDASTMPSSGSSEGAPAFVWPVSGSSVASGFGRRGDSMHDGIDIRAPVGTPVYAAADGEVIYSDVLRGYGNVIIIRHSGGFATVYAHNERNMVREGEHIRKGQAIATVGDSGRTTGPNLHFEVRKDNVARNPLDFLPSVTVAVPPGREIGG